MLRRLAACVVPVVALALALTGCTSTIHLEPAEYADDVACANASVRYPDTVSGLSRVWTDAQATAAWGSPTAVIVSCGLETPDPTTLDCVSINGVEWIIDDTDDPNMRMTTYGRTPAMQAYIDTTVVGNSALEDLASAAQQLTKTGGCTDAEVADPEATDAPESGG